MCCQCLLKQTRITTFLQRQPCLLKTISPQKLFGDVVDYVTVDHLSIIDNLIGLNSFWSGIIPPQWSNARPNFPTSNVVGGARFGWYQARKSRQSGGYAWWLTVIVYLNN